MMLRALTICIGAITGVLCAYFGAYLIGWAFGPLYNSEEDMARNIKIFLLASLALAILGAFIANCIYSKKIHKPKT